jgi:hypothetical protein
MAVVGRFIAIVGSDDAWNAEDDGRHESPTFSAHPLSLLLEMIRIGRPLSA